jgi:hypothetical protein
MGMAKTDPMTAFLVTLPPADLAELEAAARALRCPRTFLVRRAVRELMASKRLRGELARMNGAGRP